MSEEISNASTNVPRSMLVSVLLNGTLGFAMLIAVLFCSGDVSAESIIETPTGYPFIAIFVQATQSVGGSTGMAIIICALGICATIAFLASASRMTWAFARDHGLPFWRYLAKVSLCHPACSSQATNPSTTKGRTSKFHPSNLHPRHRHHLLPPRPHQHRLRHRLQRRHLPHHQRPILLLPPRRRPPPLPPLHRLHHHPHHLRSQPQNRHRRRNRQRSRRHQSHLGSLPLPGPAGHRN